MPPTTTPPPNFHKIALIGRYNSPSITAPLQQLLKFLESRALTVVIEAETARQIPLPGYATASGPELGENVDLAIVLGGDGTMLSIARLLAPYRVPIIGINQGRLGFLTDIPLSAMEETLNAMLAGQYREESRSLIEAELIRGGQVVDCALALNDAVINRGLTGSMIDCEMSIDGRFVYTLRADGLIIATPTGSTAYALSAHGPIMHPQVPAFVLVPVAPHALTNRPIAISDSCVITVTLLRGMEASLHCDGHAQMRLQEGDHVQVRRAPYSLRLLHPQNYDYYAMLRQKLHWSETPGLEKNST